jgi:hypothetical protein
MLNRKIKSQTQLLAHISATVGAWALEEFQSNNCTTAEEYAQRYNENMESLIIELQQYAWWGIDEQGQLAHRYRDYKAYCD